MTPDAERALEAPGPLDPAVILAGRAARREGRWWWAARLPAGPATLAISAGPPIRAIAWGPGAEAAVARAPDLLGLRDDTVGAFVPGRLAALARAHPELRIGRTGQVLEALLKAILGQRVTGAAAARSWRSLRERYGDPAPGPLAGLRLPPDPARLASEPSYALHAHGVERRRAEVLLEVCRRANRVRALADQPVAEAAARLGTFAGVGPWSLANVAEEAFGDPDAVPVGDFHLPHLVVHALTGAERGTDADALALLAPWAGHRARAIRLLRHLPGPPRRGPRGDDPDYRGQ